MGLLDRYEVIRHLGRGGAGDVHLARDRMLFGREVALKTIRARVDDVLRAAFEREFALLASLSVPGVAPVYDFGVMRERAGQAARPFFTRAYIEGEPLDAAVSGLDLQARLRLFVRTTAVITPLHRVGVVHGDIKPGNIIVNAQGRPYLIDFGLSRARGYDSGREHHGPLGTPAFMAPEILRGETSSVAADIYALGVTLFWLVAGEYPYAELGARAMAARLEGKPVPLPAAGGVGRSALEIAARALSGDPRDRFPCVDEMHASVERLLQGPQRESIPAVARAFVVPRPRGHKDHLARLDAFVTGRGARTVAGLVVAPAGGGKSLFLQELKWRLQLGSQLVLEVFAGRGSGALALIGLVEQLLTVLGPDHAQAQAGRELLLALRAGSLDEATAGSRLAELLEAVAAETSLALLVDDLDRADAVLGSVLRSAIHVESARGVALIASATDATAAAVRELQAGTTFELPRLSNEDVAALCSEALGALDSSVVSALCDHATGLPGALISALYELSSLTAVTPADVQALPPGAATLALTQARLARLTSAERALLDVLALVSSLPEALVPAALGRNADPEKTGVSARLEVEGIVVRDTTNLMLSDRTLRKGVLAALGDDGVKQLAARLLAAPQLAVLGLPERAELSRVAEDLELLRELALPASDALARLGAHARAAHLLDALLPHADAGLRQRALLRLAQMRELLGEHDSAATLASELARDDAAGAEERADACVVAARALTALGRWEDAITTLGRVPQHADGAKRARVQRELAKIHLRRGDYAAVSSAVELGLACAPEDDVVRVELLCSQGMAAGYRGDQSLAHACHESALALARRLGERREEANALAYLAMGAQRSGDMTSARDLFAQTLEIARELGDVGSMATASLNLGALQFYIGEPAAAAEYYTSAASLARRVGRASTQIQARMNLVHLHVYFGLYEIARGELDELRNHPQVVAQRYFAAQGAALSADLLSRAGQVDPALIGYDDAIARYTELGQTREVAEHSLDAAEALLDRNGPVDPSAAAARLATARERIEREKMEDLRLRLDLLVARTRLANGDADAAAVGLDEVVTRARKAHDRDAEWSALGALALAHEQVGSVFAARSSARSAVEVLEEIALRIPREHRDAFWQDPRRRAVRERANRSEQQAANEPRTEHHTLMADASAERERLFQIIKRLASEHDLDRLLERIIESAVDLSAAERGSVLLVDAAGHLMPQFTRTRMTVQDEALASFSRSIAEAVLIDGEAIVTVDASADGRLSSYVSVHKLMLRSVACLPIRGHAGTVGVLYLEHRRSRGRFSEESVELLSAFADQAAIAIENARLLGEIRKQKLELEQANSELEQAKADLEDLLLTRTRQLEDVQRELERVGHRSAGTGRYGMIAKSTVMHRIFDAMGRLSGNAVPVVIGGESGTGKELVARGIHDAGPRAAQAFVAINCGSLPETLLESELFGHVKGAFSGADRDKRGVIAAASGGTLFLDEVSEMPAKMQIDLLRVLEEKTVCRLGSEVEEPVDVRVLVATQRSLRELIDKGLFREDLYYRLGVVELWLPPLRERRDDIPLLCEHFLREFAERERVPRKHLTRNALARLVEHPWPGNVRQLSHVLVQACVMGEGLTIDVGDLSTSEPGPRTFPSQPPAGHEVSINTLDDHRTVEKQRILAALEACGWNRVRAAQTLGMPRRTFYRRLADYSIL